MKTPIAGTVSLVLLASLVTAQVSAQEQESTPTARNSAEGLAKKEDAKKHDKNTEVIAVTGTRIKRVDMNSAAPLTIIGREEIAATGKQTVTDLVKALPAAIGNSLTTSTTNGGGGGSGNIALRGLDSSSTLVLMNGRRLPLDANGSSPDLNSIPVAAIERIEVLQDGASAIYGSDAIAGVINIITRKGYEGLDINVYAGQASRGDMETKSVDVTYGVANDKGSMLLGISSSNQGNVASRDRDVSKVTRRPSPTTPDARVNSVIVKSDATSSVPTQGDYRPYDAVSDPYNFAQVTDAIMSQDRKSVFVGGDYELRTNLKAFVEAHYTNTQSEYDAAPTPLSLSQEVGGLKVSKDNPYNSFGNDLTNVRKRFLQFGPRTTSTTSDTIHSVAGLEGKVSDWTWDLAYNHGSAEVTSTTSNLVNKTNLQLGIGDPNDCAVLAKLGCVAVNILGPDGSLTPEMINWLRTSATRLTRTQLDSYTLNFAGELAETSFGKIGLALGAEARREEYDAQPDANSQKYNTVGSTNSKSTYGDRDIKEAYVELSVPLTELAEIDLAARHSDYSDFGTTTNPKAGLKIRPIKGLTLRGSYSTGFRAPSLVELFQGQGENFAGVSDPCQKPGACSVQADPGVKQFLALQGGNPDLDPEKSKSYTYGFTYSLDSFNAKVDYFNIKTENAIDTKPQFIIDQFRANGSFKDKITLDGNNNITQIEAYALNLAARKVEGIDLAFDYALRGTSTGAYTFNLMGSNYIKYMNQADKTSPFVNIVGEYEDASAGGRGSVPRWKGLFDFGWSNGGVDAGTSVNHVTSLDVPASEEVLAAWTTFDLRAGYDFLNYGKVSLGINNVADKDPPTHGAPGNDNIDARTHNLIGRYYYARWGVQL